MPTHRRIDLVLAVLSAMEVQEAGGWSVQDLAELCGCDPSTIQKLQRRARCRLAMKLIERDVVPKRLRRRFDPMARGLPGGGEAREAAES